MSNWILGGQWAKGAGLGLLQLLLPGAELSGNMWLVFLGELLPTGVAPSQADYVPVSLGGSSAMLLSSPADYDDFGEGGVYLQEVAHFITLHSGANTGGSPVPVTGWAFAYGIGAPSLYLAGGNFAFPVYVPHLKQCTISDAWFGLPNNSFAVQGSHS
jgi:hypothetical protein